jgi:hypothetical protein
MHKAASILFSFAVAAVLFVAASVVAAWAGPTQAPPNGNVPAPINVGTIDQIKDGGIGVNTLAVFGNAVISTVSGYLNFGATVGSSGYDFRDNAGTMEFKNNNGQWRAIVGTVNGAAGPVTSIQFSDGTTQTTAGGGGSGGGSSTTTVVYQPGMWCGSALAICNGTQPSYVYRVACQGSNLTASCTYLDGGEGGSYIPGTWTGCPAGFVLTHVEDGNYVPSSGSTRIYSTAACVKN